MEALIFCLSPVCHMQLRSEDVAFLIYSLGCSMDIPIGVVLYISLLDLVLSIRSPIPGRRSVCCVCSKAAFLCGVVSSTRGLTGWEDRCRSSVSLIIYIVRFGIVCNFVVGVRVCLGTTIVIVGTVGLISGLVFFSFELTALVLTVTWFFTMVARWFGLVGVLLWGMLRHSV